jgi:hypothetical protein
VNFSEQLPSEHWAALKYRGEKFAEVWFKPEGDPRTLAFRIPESSFAIPGLGQLITTENLLKAVAIAVEQVESWRQGEVCHSGMNGSNPELGRPLPPPPEEIPYSTIQVTLTSPAQTVAPVDANAPAMVQDLEVRWNVILGLETAIDSLRLRVESAQAEMLAASQRMLVSDEKVHAISGDVVQWNKAKSRARFALPKAKEFVHRATWVTGTPERKKLGELFKDGLRPDMPSAIVDQLPEELARLLKHHQVLSAQGGTVFQECKGITAEIQDTLRTLLSNSAAKAYKNRATARKKGKFV